MQRANLLIILQGLAKRRQNFVTYDVKGRQSRVMLLFAKTSIK